MDEITAYLPGLSPVENKELCVRFDGGRLSSDGGVLVLREIEKRLGLAARLAGCLSDARDPASTTHSYADMIGARMFAIACGYEDCDDLDVLRFDPAFKLACGRLPESGRDLMSQPTLSRLENAPSWRELARMGLTMIDLFCDSFERVPQRIVLDIDDTPDAVHGGQQLALFNAHYDEYCFQPIHIFDAATAKPVLSLLRPGKRPSGDEAARVLRHVIGRIRRHWPRVEIAVRGDGHYPLRCVTLLLRTILILFQDTVDNTDERIELRSDRRPRPDITRWRRIAQHLPDRARVDPKTTSRFALAQTLNHYRVANPPIQFHSLHPPPFAPKCKGLSLTEFCSGATRLSGRFSEGLLLRRSHR